MESTLSTKIVKYFKTEGVFCLQPRETQIVIACVAGKFVVFDSNNELPSVLNKRLLKNGGVILTPTTLEEFVEDVRKVEEVR